MPMPKKFGNLTLRQISDTATALMHDRVYIVLTNLQSDQPSGAFSIPGTDSYNPLRQFLETLGVAEEFDGESNGDMDFPSRDSEKFDP